MKNKTALIVGGVIIFIILLAIIGNSGSNNNYNSQGIDSNNGWHTIKIIDDVNGSYTKDFKPEYIKITGKKIKIDYNCTTYNPSGSIYTGLFNGGISDPDGNFSVSFPEGTDSCVNNQSFETDIPAPGIYKLWYHYGFAKVKLMISEYDYCNSNESTCDKYIKKKFYYINSENRCVLTPHNPYPSSEYCKKDVGQNCYVDDNTCGGVGNSGMVVIKGGAYKLVSVQGLKEIISNPSLASKILGEPDSSSAALVAVKGTINAIIPWDNKTDYDLVINTDDGFVLVGVGTVDVNTKTSNGFHISDFPVGTKVLAGGAFLYKDIDGKSVNLFPDLLASPHIGSGLKSLGLPTNTPVITSMMGTVEIEQ